MVDFFIFEKEENFLIFTRKSANFFFFKFTKLHFSVEFSMEMLVNYGLNQKKNRTLIDDKKYEYNFEKIKNGTEFWRCQKFKKGYKGRGISRPSTN